jgi:hypothetical protein
VATMTPSNGGFVVCQSGLVLPRAAVELALDLERRGMHIHGDGDTLHVGPRELLTFNDRLLLKRWKWHLLALVAHAAPTVQ